MPGEASARMTGNLLDWPQRMSAACTPRTQLTVQIRDRDQHCRLRFINRSADNVDVNFSGLRCLSAPDYSCFQLVSLISGAASRQDIAGHGSLKRCLTVQARNPEVSAKTPRGQTQEQSSLETTRSLIWRTLLIFPRVIRHVESVPLLIALKTTTLKSRGRATQAYYLCRITYLDHIPLPYESRPVRGIPLLVNFYDPG